MCAWQCETPDMYRIQENQTSINIGLNSNSLWRRKWQLTPVILPGESQGQRSLVGCYLWGSTESDTTEVTQQQQQQAEQTKRYPSHWDHIFIFNLFYLSIVDLKCCVNFCCTIKWFSYTYILFHILFLYGLSQDIESSSLNYTVGPCCLGTILARTRTRLKLLLLVHFLSDLHPHGR